MKKRVLQCVETGLFFKKGGGWGSELPKLEFVKKPEKSAKYAFSADDDEALKFVSENAKQIGLTLVIKTIEIKTVVNVTFID